MGEQNYVYIMFNKKNGTIYTGITSNLLKRVVEHKNKVHPNSFTARYNVDKLGYYEIFGDIRYAIEREKQIKSWSRKSKIALIEKDNPGWNDLSNDWIATAAVPPRNDNQEM